MSQECWSQLPAFMGGLNPLGCPVGPPLGLFFSNAMPKCKLVVVNRFDP